MTDGGTGKGASRLSRPGSRRLPRPGAPSGQGVWTTSPRKRTRSKRALGPKVLIRQGSGKVPGADAWGPGELAVLPTRWLDALGRMMGEWEACGAWPAPLRNILFSTIPRPKAAAEAALWAIGLLPYDRGVWMLIATTQSRDCLCGSMTGGLLGRLWRRERARIHRGSAPWVQTHSAGLPRLHRMFREGQARSGWRRAADAGLGARVPNMIFDVYKLSGHVKVHGPVARPKVVNHWLVAGCSLAKDILKAFLGPVKLRSARKGVRGTTNVDDVTLQVSADTADVCAQRMTGPIGSAQSRPPEGLNSSLNDAKQQVLGLTKKARNIWGRTRDNATGVAKDLESATMVAVANTPSLKVRLRLWPALPKGCVSSGALSNRCAL